jgi:hypothetical protein
MQMNHILAACSFMKVINILGDDCQLRYMLGKLSDSEMCPIWLRLDHLASTPLIPSPTKRWVGSERFAGRKLGGVEALPEARQRISEGWDAAFC